MNPLTNVRNIGKLNDQELKLGIFDKEKSWHNQYKDSAYIFIGGLPYDLTEGDIVCVFSQYGEIININLVRDKKSGKSKGYGFIAYEDQRSTILAVDNLNGIKLGGRTIRVDHVEEYRRPKGDEKDETGKYKEKEELGCAPKTPSGSEDESADDKKEKKSKKSKKEKKLKKAKKKEKRKRDEEKTRDREFTRKEQSKDAYDIKAEIDKQKSYKEKERNTPVDQYNSSSKYKKAYHRRTDGNSYKRRDRSRSRSPFDMR